ncbi:hypothetical protein TRICI_003204 [Trichomonascus ciferrii]|uniref:chitin synthase n=1 Tax=Trichomonascus ciferrii TaxID=44093 RepID=A0A642V9N3_9ASCO|nr:hypothetical protein TRICI_003204 [Trichomonascus ciferrii]
MHAVAGDEDPYSRQEAHMRTSPAPSRPLLSTSPGPEQDFHHRQDTPGYPGIGSVVTPGFDSANNEYPPGGAGAAPSPTRPYHPHHQEPSNYNPYTGHYVGGAPSQPYGPPNYAEDSEFYEPPPRLHQPHHQPIYPHEEHEQMPQPGYPVNEDPNSFLLQPYHPQRPPAGYHQPQQRPTRLNAFDDSYSQDPEDASFTPFPINGDQYALNTYEEEDEETEYPESEEEMEEDDKFSYQEEDPYHQQNQPLMPPPMEGMQPRRAKTMKRVRLYRGNLVLDCPVSKKLLTQFGEPRMEREFTHMRYSAATCDPSEFVPNQFTLRQTCYQQPRDTELFICVTIYNEDDILLGRTLQGIFKNIKHLASRTRSKTWGKDAWKKVVVCVVADGRFVINSRAKALMASLGVYQDGFAKNIVNDKPVEAHIYEYTTMVGINNVDKTVKLTTEKTVPVQMIFCLKEKNKKKINSHRWFFQAFGPILRPKVCVLLDAGTMPGHDSIYHLWKTFDLHPNVGGACGEIRAQLGTGWNKLINPLVAAQNFEYKMSNILDKPMESAFGFITVLPGAFSAYRYDALQNDLQGQGPLEKYFKGETLHDSGAGIFTANMYLAEDRILCFELVAKRGCDWLLKYVKSAHAETDVPDRLAELVLQRRRWLNGSFFAAIYAQAHLFSIWKSAHSIGRKLVLHLEFFYQLVSMLFSWFSIGNFFLVFRILTNSLGDKELGFAPGKVLSVVLMWIYCACIVTIFVLSFGNRPIGTHIFYIIIVAFFSFLMAYLIFAAIYISVKSVQYTICENDGFSVSLVFSNETFRDLVVSMLSTYALYIVSSLLFFEPWHLLTSFLQYLLVSPAYINVLNVYAFCNIHDISWGTKGDTEQKMDLGVAKTNQAGKLEVDIPTHVDDIDSSYMNQIQTLAEPAPHEKSKPSEEDRNRDYYALFRSTVVLLWMFTNFAIIAVVLNTAGLNAIQSEDDNDNSSSSNNGDSSSGSNDANSGTFSIRSMEVLAELVARKDCGSLGSSGSVRTQIYLSVVLWSVAGLAAFRFVGMSWYLIGRLFGR